MHNYLGILFENNLGIWVKIKIEFLIREKFQKNLQCLIAIVDGQTNQEELAPVSEWMNEAMLMNNEEPTALMSN